MYAIGLDFGTLSVRAVLVDTDTGDIIATAVEPYDHGVIEQQLPESKVGLGPDWALQHPQDWLNGLTKATRSVVAHINDPTEVVGIGIDFTACTMLPALLDGTALCMKPEWATLPNAWPKLWKHHAAQSQATRITNLAAERGEAWLRRYGGIISSEWLLPKALQILEESPEIYAVSDRMLEAVDWVVWQLTGEFKRNACAAGFKGQWHKQYGYPNQAFLRALHPNLEKFYTTKGFGEVVAPGDVVGQLVPEWAAQLGLPPEVKVAAGLIDAHAGVVGAGVAEPGILYIAMGTSSCHMLLGDQEVACEGISGVVADGILPGWFGYEAGQVAVGDIFDWFAQHSGQSHDELTKQAAQFKAGESGLLAVDWWNGCRTPLVDADLSGAIIGYTLQTSPAAVYRALIEATAFGTKMIVETFSKTDLGVHRIRSSGGLTKNDLLLQIYADVTGLPFEICPTEQASGLGAAILGALAGGAYPTIGEAVAAIAPLPSQTITPQTNHRSVYDKLYKEYVRLVNWFGQDEDSPLKRLRALRSM